MSNIDIFQNNDLATEAQSDFCTREEAIARYQAIVKSKRDIAWWAEHFFRIIPASGGLQVIKLYQKQRDLLQHFVDNSRTVTLASRQIGKCVLKDSKIKIRNKKTNEILELSIEEFFKSIDNKYKQISINKKFVESFDVDDYEIMTDTGWKDVKAIHKTIAYRIWVLVTKNYELMCADNHIVFDKDFNEVFVKDLVKGQLIQTQSGLDEVLDVFETDQLDNMYDVELENNSNHRYYTNGILSHNTTCYTMFCLWLATLFSEKRIMITANKLQTAIEVMDRIRLSYDYLPKWLKPKTTIYNKGEIAFSNKSIIRATATSSSASRGFSCNCLCIDEIAFIPKNIMDDFWASVVPIVSSDKKSKIIAVSTPNGASGKFYELWQQANSTDKNKNVDGWTPFRIDWWEVPNRDEKWKQQQIATIGKDKWLQEFCNEFIAGSKTQKLIPDDVLEKYRKRLTEFKTTGEIKGKIQQVTAENEKRVYEFTMWHEFKPGHAYAAAVDIAEGTGGDSSVLYIFDISNIKSLIMCAKFSSATVSTVEFAYVITKILKLYNNPWLICESNGIGTGFLDTLRITYNYENIVREGKDNKYGITSHIQVKGKACLWLREMFTTSGIDWILYDTELIEEIGHFIKKDSKVHTVYNAAVGAHDDHIMALCWLAWLLNPDVITKYYIVVAVFKTDLDKILPKQISPLQAPTNLEITSIANDPLTIEYMEFKKEIMQKLQNVAKKENQYIENSKNKMSFEQLFFSEQQSQEEEWASPWVPMSYQTPINNEAQQLMNNKPPMFFVNNSNWNI